LCSEVNRRGCISRSQIRIETWTEEYGTSACANSTGVRCGVGNVLVWIECAWVNTCFVGVGDVSDFDVFVACDVGDEGVDI
jgi:hypothetical protein